ncbi:hypothetical protein [Hyphomicrobium sp.]|uniref:hypothetical protein n=1 Tax=Hyphomicrobium sp. TaxID=82 RepID=UPI0025BFB340|nr:hypothetical protein [Hyphomicrobium sp.]MCC7253954.1 hypothetical protein [Hyphomicrobium sp.]
MLRRLWARVLSINIPLAAAALFAAAILHILATLATPHLIPTSGYGRLAGDLPENTMQVLPVVAPDAQPLPFLSPDARYAVCRFDTRDGAVSISAALPDPGWVLALFSPAGDNFFTSVASPERRPEVSLLLVPGDDTWRLGTGSGPGVAVTGEATLTIPANEGIVVIRAPDRGEAYRPRALAELKRATCRYRRTRAS